MNEALRFQLAKTKWTLQFNPTATDAMLAHAQTTKINQESVGHLYTRDLTCETVIIDLATWLHPKVASWGQVKFDPRKALEERKVIFAQGLHCVGLWHTHPESHPRPSFDDRALARDNATSAAAHHSGIVSVIVGTLPSPHGFKEWVDNGVTLLPALPVHVNAGG